MVTKMKAAVVDSFGAAPRFAEFEAPTPTEHEVLVQVTAAALHPVVRALAGGEHYGSANHDSTDHDSTDALPMIPGVDGVGRMPDGTRVYFGGARDPFGTMAEVAPVPRGFYIPLPDDLDDVTAAAIMNPGMAAWLGLTWRAALQPGETVLVLGATGTSGRIAVRLAGRLGAGRVIAAGRDQAVLDRLVESGDTAATVRLTGEGDAAAIRAAAGAAGIHVIIDYLWGRPAEAAIAAITRRGLMHVAPRVRHVQLGQSAGPTITLNAEVLRSSGLEIVGSGAGTVPVAEIMKAIPEFMALASTGELPIDIAEMSLADVESAWRRPDSGHRIVFRP
jgi:NADPH:quinone reductase-like Zn-dependent oxidoreductase